MELIACGVFDIGENRVQEAALKHGVIGDKAVWHLVGHLQTNKVADAVRIFSLIHSVDSLKLAAEISKEAKKIGKTQHILIQVNVSAEASKFGVAAETLPEIFKEMALYPNITIDGLMTIAPEVKDPEEARPCFRRLRELRDGIRDLRLTTYDLQLSMGMTNDFEVAIEEGATIVRVGRAIFNGDG
jgi:pyridoxal phosphate enzyme (YggS family)